ncbi:MAG: biotin--[acetyl-CoA-carboxylase] ligase [Bacteroidales bacterium]|jgi:BirA family biotin operon repressor/biotin-[acetyl-CoA-carboxylase] ligase|nr:biotin--[acetyl-CoA-carboxylase] ligase [Bacteroidales bacterium]
MEIYKNIQYYKEIFSTNTFAYSIMRDEKPPEFTVIVGDNQTHGKGQKNNVWISNPGENLTFSIIFYPHHISASKQFIISECISLAIRNVVAQYCPHTTIKWPNDVYVGDSKIAGILIEHVLSGSAIAGSVVGVGLNCNQLQFPDILPNPTSIKQYTGQDVVLHEVLYALLAEFHEIYCRTKSDTASIHTNYLQHIYLFETFSAYKDVNGEFRGKIIHIDENGLLHICDELGKIRTFFFKEVELVLNNT